MFTKITPTKHTLLLSIVLISGNISDSNAQKVNLDGSFPSCRASEDMIFGSKGWIYEYWEWNSAFEFTTAEAILDMDRAFKKRGINLILVPVPNRTVKYANYVNMSRYYNIKFSSAEYITNWNKMVDQISNLGVNVINILPDIENYKTGIRGEALYYPRDHHWTTSGAESSSQTVALAIKKIIKDNSISLKPVLGALKVVKQGYNSGSFGDHYNDKCKNKPPNMNAYQATNTIPKSGLLENIKPELGVFGDSFGLSSPDNNFSTFIEHYSGLRTVNYSNPGIGQFGSLVGYLADPKISKDLPPFIVVPTLSWLPNDPIIYRQITAEVKGCTHKSQDAATIFKSNTTTYNYAPSTATQSAWNSIHIGLNLDAKQVNIEVRYDDESTEKLTLIRNSNDYYKGDLRNFYITLSKNKKIKSADISIDKFKKFSGTIEVCNLI